MIARSIHDTVNLTLATGTTPATFTIKQQRRRLEGLIIITDVSYTGAATSAGGVACIGRVQVNVNDVAGSRNLVDATGVGLVDEHLYMGGSLPASTRTGYGGAAATYRIVTPVWIRHPQLDDPFGNLTSLPLSQLRSDVTVNVYPAAAIADVAATTLTYNGCIVKILYRDTDSGDYIPSEILTNTVNTLTAGARSEWEIPSTGILTSMTVQHFNEASRVYRTRGDVLSSTGDTLKLMYGREEIRSFRPKYEHGFCEMTTDACGLADPNSFIIDLMDDLPQVGPYSANSGLNLSAIRAGGDVAKLVWTNVTASNLSSAMVTTRKFLGGPVGLIQRA